MIAIVRPGDLGDDDEVAGPGTTTTAPVTSSTTAPPTTSTTATTAPGQVTTTTQPGSGLGGEGAGEVDGDLADTGGFALAPLGAALLAGGVVLHVAGRVRRPSGGEHHSRSV